MKTIKNVSGLIFLMIITMTITTLTGWMPAVVGGGLYAASMLPKPQGSLFMALDVEIWKPWIVEQLFANNDFINYAQNADDFVLNGKVVHIPNAGAASGAKKNRLQLPATVTRRKDVDVTYSLDEYTTNPRLIENADKILSYDKMNSAMGQDMRYIKELVAEGLLYNWRPETANIIDTTGASTATHLSGTTGNRKKFQLANLEEAMAVMDDWNIPSGDRYALMSSRMHQQFVSQLSTSDYKDFSKVYDPVKGIVGELFGFKIIKRSSVLRASSAKAFRDPDPDVTTAAVTDVDVVMCWHMDAVERALGTTTLFEKLGDPLYYGDIYSLLLRCGGRKVREDGKGVISINQVNV